jgi:hypothetical protein
MKGDVKEKVLLDRRSGCFFSDRQPHGSMKGDVKEKVLLDRRFYERGCQGKSSP